MTGQSGVITYGLPTCSGVQLPDADAGGEPFPPRAMLITDEVLLWVLLRLVSLFRRSSKLLLLLLVKAAIWRRVYCSMTRL
jgi:hypothetical protein